MVATCFGGAAHLSAQSLVQTFFVPIPEEDARTWANAISLLPANDEIHSVVSISPTSDGTVIYYDQWENGYETDPENPSDLYSNPGNLGGTQIWGDNDPSNGIPPGFGADVINAGDVIVLESDVPLPRDPVAANSLFDGRDKFGSTELLAVTRAAWPSTGIQAQLGAATEVPDTSDWCTRFETPVGIDAQTTPDAFEWVALAIIAEKDNTLVSVDANADGDFLDAGDLADVPLDEGETVLVEDVLVGAEVQSTGLVAVDVLTGDFDSTYEGRWFSLIPFVDWGDSYFSPVGDTTIGGRAVSAFIYNPGTSDITVQEDDLVALGELFSVPAGSVVERLLPENATPSAVRLFTPGNEPFYAVVVVDPNEQVHDWGYTLIPERDLTIRAAVGWAPGSTNSTENASPIWVTPEANTTFQFDCDGDGTAEATQAVQALESYRFFIGGTPPAGCVPYDATGLRISTTDDVKFAAAWGQDPANSDSGQPQQLDMGTAVLPLANPFLLKSSELAVDVNGNGSLDPGDTLRYSLTVESTGTTDLIDVVVSDLPDPNTTYVPNSTVRDGTTQIPDSGTTPFPLDEGGASVGTLSPNQTLIITYLFVLDDPLTEGVTGITNTARITVGGEFASSSTSSTPVLSSAALITKVSNATGTIQPGDTIDYTIVITNTDSSPLTGIEVSDALPAGTSYVAESTSATGPVASGASVIYEDTTSGPIDNVTGCGGGELTREFDVTEDLTLTDVQLGFNADHPSRADIDVSLESPTGTQVLVITEPTGTDDNDNYDVLLDDASASPLNDGSADDTSAPYYDRTAAPINPLSAFDGESSLGTWTLTVCDQFTGFDSGTYNRSQLVLTGTGGPITKTNQTGDLNPLSDGVPPNLVTAADGFVLAQGEQLTVTFQVMVDPSLDPNITTIPNTASVSTNEQAEPHLGTVIDPVSTGALIGDSVWLDTDGDGIQDIGEAGLSNVHLELYADPDGTPGNGDEILVATTTSDVLGNYIFSYVYLLAAGSYYVDLDESTLPAGLEAAPGNNNGISDPITVSGEFEYRDADFGYRAPGGPGGSGVIGDYLWSDADGDGVQDPGEPGIGNVTVELRGPGPDGILGTADDQTVTTAFTTPDGRFLFTNIPPGQYQVAVTDVGGWLAGYAPTAGPQSEGSYLSRPITVVSGGVISDVDFGFDNDTMFSITDRVWLDADGDGIADAGEAGGVGVTVNLLLDPDGVPGNGDETVVATAFSDANGDFSFDGVRGGFNYAIEITDAAGVLRGAGGTTTAAQAGFLAIPSLSGDVSGTNFGFNALSALFGTVWNDADGNGYQDSAEIGLGGVTVELEDGICTLGVDCPITLTTPDGFYFFRGLNPNIYTVVVTDLAGVLAGYTQTGDPDEPGTCAICDSMSTTVVDLTTGDQFLDFGYQNGLLDDISGALFDDADADGVQDPGEGGLAGVTVVLLDDAGLVLATAITDANGDYLFPDLPAGDYGVRVTDDTGVLDGYWLTSGLDELPAQPGDSGVDFGYTRNPGIASIGDRVWLDADGDGQDGPNEAGLPGVTVELWDDTDRDGVLNPANDTLLTSTVTDANGDYVFDSLSAGSYFVDVDESTLPGTNPGDLVGTTYPAGVDPAAVIALSATQRFGRADFGYVPDTGTVVLGDRIWYDANGDGFQDPGEIGIGGVDVTLFGPGCSPCTVTTAADGSWLATGLAAGEYFVSYDSGTLPSGYNTIPTNLGGDDVYNLTVAADDVMTQLDFGFDGGTTATIGDLVWRDENGDGAKDPSEPGIAGVTVNLLDASGNILASTRTAADGSYLFSGVPDGSYTVSLSDIDGVLVGLQQTYDPDEPGVCATCDAEGSVTVSGGVSNPADLDFGFAPSGGTGTIGDFVWHDGNGNGAQDPGESGIQGVTLELWLDVDGDGVITPGVDNLVRSASTDQNGEYGFTSLPDGDYVVRVTDTSGVVASFVQTGDPDETGTCTVCDGQGVLTLTGGSGDFDQDFGYAAPVGMAYTISGTVFDDENQNGIFDDSDESGVPGALVVLFSDLDGDGVLDPEDPLLGSTTTDASGDYLLIDLPPGAYLVAVDTAGTTVDGFLQTTQAGTAGLQPVTIAAVDVVDQDFGFWSGGFITTPVTLAYFRSSGSGSVSFEWATATETGHLGFHLYGLAEDGLRRLHETLIPSPFGDALTPQSYTLEASGVDGDLFLLEDVDIFGQTRYHGPFELGRTYGREVGEVQRTDWSGIRREHEAKAAARKQRLPAGLGSGLRAGASIAPAVQLRVRQDGIYRVTYEALLAAGVDLGGAPADRLALLESGEPVPMLVSDSGTFGPGSYVEFVGRGLNTLYTDANVYTLKADPHHALRVGRSGRWVLGSVRTPEFYYQTRTVETNRAYDFAAPGDEPWYDKRMLAISDPVEASFVLELDDRVPQVGAVELTVALWGVTDFPQTPDHHVVIEVNGVELANEWFDGLEDHPVEVEIPDWVLEPQDNVMRVLLPHDTGAQYDLVNYDHYSVRFPRPFTARDGRLRFSGAAAAFRVEGLPSAEVVVYRVVDGDVEIVEQVNVEGSPGAYSAVFSGTESPAEYFVSTVEALRVPLAESAPAGGITLQGEAEMLIISHPDFLQGLEPLIAARRSEGLSVQVFDVEDLYQHYSHGVFDPQAIHSFIREARAELGTEYVLLVGGDTYDYFDYLGQGAMSFVPTLYIRTDRIVHYAPVDPLYGDVDDDSVPDVAVGRWPVRTSAELAAVLERTLQYAEIDYQGSAVVSADAFDAPSGYSFSDASEEMLSYLPKSWQIGRVYLDELPLQEARQLLVDSINYGVALTSYLGHSGPSVWSFDGLFTSEDADALDNFDRPTVVTQWGCWNTYHVMPTYDTLGHRLLLNEGRGAAAVMGAATLTEAPAEQRLGRRLFERIGSQRLRLGQALIDAKQDLAATDPDRLDVLLGWTLLGDPTLVVEP